MRTLLIAGAVIALVAADGAAAQVTVHHGAGYPMPGAGPVAGPRPMPSPMPGHRGGDRWGNKIGGHWWGGAGAPGGWQSYRRPVRGFALPRYWVAPRFYISDWASYGLDQPPVGYTWARYYDDAVLIDSRGSVYDSVDGVDWDGYGSDATIDYAHDVPPPHGHGHGPGFRDDGPPPGRWHEGYRGGHGGSWRSPDGTTIVTTTTGDGEGRSWHSERYYGGGTTTVTIETAPAVTTTTTETYEDAVTYSRPHVRKVWHKKRVWHPRPKCSCRAPAAPIKGS